MQQNSLLRTTALTPYGQPPQADQNSKASRTLNAPASWSGRIWGRTGCSNDTTGKFTCQTADCANKLECGGAPPSTLVEFVLPATDFYDICLVDGFNLPVSITPQNSLADSTAPQCKSNVLEQCPQGQQTEGPKGNVTGGLSACNVYHFSPETCRPTLTFALKLMAMLMLTRLVSSLAPDSLLMLMPSSLCLVL